MMSLHNMCNASPEKPVATTVESTQEEDLVVVVNKAKRIRSNDSDLLEKKETMHAALISMDTSAFTSKQKTSHAKKIV